MVDEEIFIPDRQWEVCCRNFDYLEMLWQTKSIYLLYVFCQLVEYIVRNSERCWIVVYTLSKEHYKIYCICPVDVVKLHSGWSIESVPEDITSGKRFWWGNSKHMKFVLGGGQVLEWEE